MSDRFAIRTAAEMTIGEPYRNGWGRTASDPVTSARTFIANGAPASPFSPLYFTEGRRGSGGVCVVDLHDDWHRSRSTVSPPTDAEICEAYAKHARSDQHPWHGEDAVGGVLIGAYSVPMVAVRAAWSRELRRRVDAVAAERREKERMRIVCEGTLPEDY